MKIILYIVSLFFFSNIASAQATHYTYDNRNRLTQVMYPDSSYITYSYDNGGNRVNTVIHDPCSTKPRPVISVSGPVVFCAGGSVNLAFTPTAHTVKYNWSNGDSIDHAISVTTSGHYAIAVIDTFHFGVDTLQCYLVSDSVAVTVNPMPTVSIPSGQIKCVGASTDPVNFTGSVTGALYAWTNNNTDIGLAGSGAGNIASFVTTNGTGVPDTATVSVTPSAGGCTGATQSFTIVVNPIPDIATLTSQMVCGGTATTAVVFTGSVIGTTYNWANDNTSVGLAASGSDSIASFIVTNTTGLPVVATITVTPTFAGCIGTAQVFTITVNPMPTVSTPTNQIKCVGSSSDPVIFTGAVAGSLYSWANSDAGIGLAGSGTGNIASFVTANSTSVPDTATISITPSAGGCTGSAQSFTIIVNPIPNAVTPADQLLCSGATTAPVHFTGSVSGTTYNWANDNTSIGLAAIGSDSIVSFIATNPTGLPVVATITVTPTFVGCTGTTQIFTIRVNPMPTVSTTSNQVKCVGAASDPIVFASSVIGTLYTWANNNTDVGLVSSGIGNIASFVTTNGTNMADTAAISVTPSAGGCTGVTQSFTIIVNPIPDVATLPNQTSCGGTATASVDFTGSVSGTIYHWANDNTSIGLAASGSGNIPSFIATNTTGILDVANITVTPAFYSCAGAPQIFTITVNPMPTAITPTNQVKCMGASSDPVIFTGVVAGSIYTWTNNNTDIGLAGSGTGNILSFVTTNVTGVPDTAIISISPSAGGCTGAIQNFTIIVNPIPDVVTPSSQLLCSGTAIASVNFTGSVSGTTYYWVNNRPGIGLVASGSGNIPSFIATNTTGEPVIATITVTPTFFGCTGASQVFTITVNPMPTVLISADQVKCVGTASDPINFTGAVAGSLYAWANNNTDIGLSGSGSGNIASFVTTNITNVPDTATISVTPSALGCTGTTQSFAIIVNPIPDVTIPPDQLLCSGVATAPVNFSGAVSSTTYNWTNDHPGIGLAAIGSGSIASFIATNTTGSPVVATITVTPTFFSCTGTPHIFTMTVNPLPTVSPPSNQVKCAGAASDPVTFTGAVAGSLYSWTNNNTVIGLSGSGAGNIASFVTTNGGSVADTATIRIIPTAAGCTGTTQSFTIIVNPIPNVVPPVNQMLCNGTPTAPMNFTGSVIGTTYDWTNDHPSIGLAANGSGDISSFIATNMTGTPVVGTITITPVFYGCIGSAHTLSITVNPLPTISTIVNNVRCFGDNSGGIIVIAIGGQPPYLYSIDASTPTTINTFQNLFAGNYIINAKDSFGCSSQQSITISQPTVNLSATTTSKNTNCFGDKSGTITTIANGGTPPYIYSINGGASFTGVFDSLFAGKYIINVTDTNNCHFYDTIIINQPQKILGAIDNITPDDCFPGGTGSITVSSMGGGGRVQYSMNGNSFQSSPAFSSLIAGSYTITAKDSNGCTYVFPFIQLSNTTPENGLAVVLNNGVLISPYSLPCNWYKVGSGNSIDTEILHSCYQFGDYFVTGIDINGCLAMSDTIHVRGGVDTNINFIVYPNPASDYATIKCIFSGQMTVKLKIFDEAGRLVELFGDDKPLTGNYTTTIQTSKFSNGHYIIRAFIGDHKFVRKIVIMNK